MVHQRHNACYPSAVLKDILAIHSWLSIPSYLGVVKIHAEDNSSKFDDYIDFPLIYSGLSDEAVAISWSIVGGY